VIRPKLSHFLLFLFMFQKLFIIILMISLLSCKNDKEITPVNSIVHFDIKDTSFYSDSNLTIMCFEKDLLSFCYKYSETSFDCGMPNNCSGYTYKLEMQDSIEIESYDTSDFIGKDEKVDKNVYYQKYKYLYNYAGPGINGNVSDGEGYLRFRIPANEDDWMYGWMLVEQKGHVFTLKGFAYNQNVNASIKTGEISN